MKREKILFYLTNGRMIAYLTKSGVEHCEVLDTSSFFKLQEISDVKKCSSAIAKLVAKMNFGLYYLKPQVTVLYNDITSCDLKFLYEKSLEPFGASKIDFVPISELVKTLRPQEDTVISDGECYTILSKREKTEHLTSLDFEPIILGIKDTNFTHFADEDIIWKTFKTHFTND